MPDSRPCDEPYPCPECGGHTRLETTGGLRRCVKCGAEVYEDDDPR